MPAATSSSSFLLRGGAALSAALRRPSPLHPLPRRRALLLRPFSSSSPDNSLSLSPVDSPPKVNPSFDSPQTVNPVDSPSTVNPSPDPTLEVASLLDIRVGKVLKAWPHPDAESLFVEEVDVGEPEPRTICSGLVGFVPLENIQHALVLVLANLKPRNMRGIKSNGMLLAASDRGHETVELLVPPPGSIPGERAWFGDEAAREVQPEAASPNQVQKKKIWEAVQPRLRTKGRVAVLGDLPLRTSAGVVVSATLEDANIS